jgi:hypothetical protein
MGGRERDRLKVNAHTLSKDKNDHPSIGLVTTMRVKKMAEEMAYEPNQTAIELGYEKKPDIGISAQDVQAIFPEIIAPAPIDSKYMTVRYEKLIPLLIEAIKDQQLQIEHLRSLIQPR